MNSFRRLFIIAGCCTCLFLAVVSGVLSEAHNVGVHAAEERLEMDVLLDWVVPSGETAPIAVASQLSGATVIVSETEDNPDVLAFVRIGLSGIHPDDDVVYYVVNKSEDADAFDMENNNWQGPLLFGPFRPDALPDVLELPLKDFVAEAPVMLAVNALLAPDKLYLGGGLWSIDYIARSDTDAEILMDVHTASDTDVNALPNDLSLLLGLRHIWTGKNDLRDVVGANLDFADLAHQSELPEQTLRVIPAPGVMMDMPTRDAFAGAALITKGEDVIGVVQVANTLEGLADVSTAKGLDAWESSMPGELAEGARPVAVHFFKAANGVIQLMETISPLSAQLTVMDVDIAHAAPNKAKQEITLWHFPLALEAGAYGYYRYHLPEDGVWSPVSKDDFEWLDDVLTARISQNGMVVPLVTETIHRWALNVDVVPESSGRIYHDFDGDWAEFPMGDTLFFDDGAELRLMGESISSRYYLQQWHVDNAAIDDEPIIHLVMNADKSVVAQFGRLVYLTLVASELGGIALVAPDPEECDEVDRYCFQEGTEITLRAEAGLPEHHVLHAWIIDGIEYGASTGDFSDTYTLTLADDAEAEAVFRRKLRIDEANLERIPVNRVVPVTLTGVFPTWMGDEDGLSAQDAEERYEVLIGGAQASFIQPEETPFTASGQGIDLLDEEDVAATNAAYIWTPEAIPLDKDAESVLLHVRDRLNPLNFHEMTLPVTRFAPVVRLDIDIVAPDEAHAFVLTTPDQSVIHTLDGTVALTLQVGDYLAGERVELDAVPPHTFDRYRITTGEETVSVTEPAMSLEIWEDTHVEAIFAAGAYQLRLISPEFGHIEATPDASAGLPAGWYYADAEVTLLAVYPADARFVAWTHDLAGERGNPVSLEMDGDKVVSALILSEAQTSLTIIPAEGGTVDVRPSGMEDSSYPGVHVYDAGAGVQLTAKTSQGYRFDSWRILEAGDEAYFDTRNPLTLTLTNDLIVEPLFVPVFRLHASVTPETGGTIRLTPPQPGTGYDAGTEVRVEAIADEDKGYHFSRWTGENAHQLLPNSTTAAVTLVMDSDKTLVANFARFTITDIYPAESWIFGGIVARVSGAAFSEDVRVYIGDRELVPFHVAPSGETMFVEIPPSDDAGDADLFRETMEVVKGDLRVAHAPGFTYRRRQAEGGVYTSAFIAANAGEETEVAVARFHEQDARVIVPPLGDAPTYGIIRIATSGTLAAGDADMPGAAVQGLYDLSVHLFTPSDDPNYMPQFGVMSYKDVTSKRLAFDRPFSMIDAQEQESRALRFSMAVNPGAAPVYEALRRGLSLWGVASQYDYLTRSEHAPRPVPVYQSQLLGREMLPADNTLVPSTDRLRGIVGARIYGGNDNVAANSFTWRQGAVLPVEMRPMVRLTAVNNRLVDGTGSGSVSGGTIIQIVSPGGGLGWIDGIEFVSARANVGGMVATRDRITRQGDNEYVIEFRTPESARPGTASIVMRPAADQTQEIRLAGVFEYTRAPIRWWLLLLIMIGIAFSIIGMATGG